ncbi:nucleotidyltransferase family protein [Robbsia sp. Bb-Pol-6]|uniref:Nucleotidyltransferase family protein n=1 Tax=Robbsia betulipollinis TaxID=2981849 RepID=A0ABT3ZN42_9BURK|nr:nucleotidyltransferase family protein [Robbsia betulipollinis]MCY0387365.1 nucleotidyltransferase family protein [Robbsia betulipollinis]
MDTAMIFAAGRGERMRPLTDHTPKPLLEAGGKPLIVWQIEALARAGIRRIVINHAWLGEQFAAALGDGSRWGVSLRYSAEGARALETAGGIAQALPLLAGADAIAETGEARAAGAPAAGAPAAGTPAATHTVFLAVAGDVFCDFDFATLRERARAMHQRAQPAMHLVMVPNPPFHPHGDFAFDGETLSADGPARFTFASFGLYDSRTFAAIARRAPVPRMALLPFFREAIASGRASAEVWRGRWANVGTPAELTALDTALRANAR